MSPATGPLVSAATPRLCGITLIPAVMPHPGQLCLQRTTGWERPPHSMTWQQQAVPGDQGTGWENWIPGHGKELYIQYLSLKVRGQETRGLQEGGRCVEQAPVSVNGAKIKAQALCGAQARPGWALQ